MRAYKVFNPDWTCKDFQYEVGQTYRHNGDVSICESGFHACKNLIDCFSYYSFDPNNKVAEVECGGTIKSHSVDSKIACSEITIVRELTWQECLDLVNTGKGNTGKRNSGNRNSGDWNSGNGNSGNRNSGDRNSGDWNSGYGNSGNRNSGDWNSGDWNSGYGNSGNRNSGDWNSGDWNSGNRNSGYGNSGYGNSTDRSAGIFCSQPPPILSFNQPTDELWDEIYHPDFSNYQLTYIEDDELKTRTYEEMWAHGWEKDSDENRLRFFNLPNFDLEVFKEITGLDVRDDYEKLMGGS